MKTLKVTDEVHEGSAEVTAKTTYETTGGKWVAEVDESEVRRACDDLCHGVKNCSCETMHGQAEQDDDGKEYNIKGV